ncbi:endonuclease/exonuclease/phosphatase family metal-dependent hydrolase [Flavobacterium gossypii]|uniref:Endonuclease/exonuclease/phosphatase family metal-dependent hydrolase n=1 Tax=Flavobacterium gossypii TaxID=1646119 RepID=A0ABR6DT00_9FLAO|nr:T9SS type A sorting domain-containing protein [Flavobacterium gossypii]MBA9074812.1 endonuclease/exonuclease/phosphatase family metal-dependent hydrolase [Flavobacterium gossypii]
MQNYFRLLVLLVLSGFTPNLSSAQTTILDQTLLTAQSFNTFTAFSVTGSQNWSHSTTYGAMCNGYAGGQSFENEDWLISSAMNLYQTDNVKLTFNHTRGNAGVLNVGVAEGWYKVFATANYTGDPATTTWVELTGLNQTVPTAWQYVASGQLVLPDAAKSENSRIAFRYKSSATQSATWEIKNVKVVGQPQATNPNAGVFKITNWNTEWLGCTSFGPTNESQQIANVAAAMLSMNSDIYCIQEVSNSAANPSIATLVSLLGSDEWEGKIVPTTTGDCDQRQGIIYKKSKVQFVSATQLSSGSPSQGNSYNYNWSGGRYPALYTVNLISGTTLVPVSIVNIHAKAEDGNAASYTRRLGASQALKMILDGTSYNSKNLILIGDFNDYLIGTTSDACACTLSPYKNFVDDEVNYNSITKNMVDVNQTWGTHPIIENIIISNELSTNYVSSSTAQEAAIVQNISNYYNTTSNHLPVSATFQFSVLGTPEYTYTQKSLLSIYPNPVKEELQFDTAGLEDNATAQIFDLTGRQMSCRQIDVNTVSVTSLPTGIYILKVGNRSGKFVKE